MRCGLIAIVDSTPVAMRMQSFTVSTLSNMSSQACARHALSGPLTETPPPPPNQCRAAGARSCQAMTMTPCLAVAMVHIVLDLKIR